MRQPTGLLKDSSGGKLVRIFIGDSDRWHHQSLHRAFLERLRREGFAGATVVHGVAGFGARSVIHTSSIVDLSADLPVLIEVVDDDEHIQNSCQFSTKC